MIGIAYRDAGDIMQIAVGRSVFDCDLRRAV
jgi:hypothetical protein